MNLSIFGIIFFCNKRFLISEGKNMDEEPEEEKYKLKEEYQEEINRMILICNDIELLDFIFQLLHKNLA